MSSEQQSNTFEKDRSQGAVLTWFEERMQAATMQVWPRDISNTPEWGPIRGDDEQTIIAYGSIDEEGRPTGKFFTVEGFLIATSGREVDGWGQLGIVEVVDPNDPDGAAGTVALLYDRKTRSVLLQTAAEPLNVAPGEEPGAYLVLRATIQGSYDNIRQHKANIPFSDRIDQTKYRHFTALNPSRFRGKVRYGFTEVDRDTLDLSTAPNHKWFTKEEVDQAIREGAPSNAAFHAAYSLLKAAGRRKIYK